MAAAEQLQCTVDEGDQPWRLDPLESARADAVTLGLSADDGFDLLSIGTGVAEVRAQHGGTAYIIDLVQPARLGSTGIWTVVKLARAPALLAQPVATAHAQQQTTFVWTRYAGVRDGCALVLQYEDTSIPPHTAHFGHARLLVSFRPARGSV